MSFLSKIFWFQILLALFGGFFMFTIHPLVIFGYLIVTGICMFIIMNKYNRRISNFIRLNNADLFERTAAKDRHGFNGERLLSVTWLSGYEIAQVGNSEIENQIKELKRYMLAFAVSLGMLGMLIPMSL